MVGKWIDEDALSQTLLPSGSINWYWPPTGVASVLYTTSGFAGELALYATVAVFNLTTFVLPCFVSSPCRVESKIIIDPSASVNTALFPPGIITGFCVMGC